MALDQNSNDPQFAAFINDKQAKKVKRANQARINGAKSHGPITPEGKKNSSGSAIRHGLTANEHTLIPGEDPAQYTEVYNACLATYRPGDKTELRLVEKLANLDWRLERFAMMETALLTMTQALAYKDIIARFVRLDAIGLIVKAWQETKDASHCLNLLYRYMGSLQSQFNSTLKNFRNLEKRRLERKEAGLDLDEQFGPPYRPPALVTFDPPEADEPAELPTTKRSNQPNRINELPPLPKRPAA